MIKLGLMSSLSPTDQEFLERLWTASEPFDAAIKEMMNRGPADLPLANFHFCGVMGAMAAKLRAAADMCEFLSEAKSVTKVH